MSVPLIVESILVFITSVVVDAVIFEILQIKE